MRIAMFTNTFTPHIGGVARSVAAFTAAFRARGHRVLVVAPEVDGHDDDELDVARVPAIQHFNGTDFAVPLPIPGFLNSTLAEFEPDVVHAHHAFLLGDTALRVAAAWNIPVVFTHHTQYEMYTHYVPGDSQALRRFVRDLTAGYANLADSVVAPSASIAGILRSQGVTSPIDVIPTGFDPAIFRPGPMSLARRRFRIPEGAFVIGHVGRLAPEKNLEFLGTAVSRALRRCPWARFLVVGDGPSAAPLRAEFERHGLADRLHMLGVLDGDALVDAYRAMDAFAFASLSETQGMVLAEALACGVPLVALDAPGAREIVQRGVNGTLLRGENVETFTRALQGMIRWPTPVRAAYRQGALESARALTLDRSVDRALALYARLIGRGRPDVAWTNSLWFTSIGRIRRELEILGNLAHAVGDALTFQLNWK